MSQWGLSVSESCALLTPHRDTSEGNNWAEMWPNPRQNAEEARGCPSTFTCGRIQTKNWTHCSRGEPNSHTRMGWHRPADCTSPPAGQSRNIAGGLDSDFNRTSEALHYLHGRWLRVSWVMWIPPSTVAAKATAARVPPWHLWAFTAQCRRGSKPRRDISHNHLTPGLILSLPAPPGSVQFIDTALQSAWCAGWGEATGSD